MGQMIVEGSTDQTTVIDFIDSSEGTPETGVSSATAGLALWYWRPGSSNVSFDAATPASVGDSHVDGGLIHLGGSKYRLDLPDAACASGVDFVEVGGYASGMIMFGPTIPLVAYDFGDSMRMGMRALPNAAADGAGGLPISDAGGLDLDAMDSNVTAILADTGTTIPGTITTLDGKMDSMDTQIAAILDDTGTSGVVVGSIDADGSSFSQMPWNASWDTEVQSEVQDALEANNLDHLAKTATASNDMTSEVADNTILSRMLANGDTSAFDPSTDGLQPFRDALSTASNTADVFLEEALAGHTTAGSLGKAINDILTDTAFLGEQISLSGTSTGGTASTIVLTGGVATDKYYNGQLVIITGGTGEGQARTVLSYAAAGTVATITRDWVTTPSSDSTFVVIGADVPGILEAGTATAGGAASITLDSNASSVADIFNDNIIMITGGTGIGQSRSIYNYTAGRVATVAPAWTTQPDNTSIYQIMPLGKVNLTPVSTTAVTDDIMAEVIEGTLTTKQALILLLAHHTGKSSGGGTNTLVYRNTIDSQDALTFTVDANGNRSAVVRNP